MKRKVSRLRPSPNEEARLMREEHERRRKLRIQQVREQQRHIALQIRQEVEQRRQRELEQLGEELRQDWERQQKEKLETLQRLYQENLQLLGQGHRSAKENEPDLVAIAQKEEENHTKAEERYREALKDLKSQRLKEQQMQTRAINARKKALQAEKKRSAKVASLPPPPPNPIQKYVDFKKPHLVRKSDISAFASTHYHMPESTVDKEVDTQQPDAREEAEMEVKRLQHLQRDEKGRREEQLEKARLRGKQALRREQLMQDRERLLVELEHMQQTDMLRRRQQVSQMPPQIFQPLYKRHEMREDLQREMEFAFEDMYTGERRVKGDLVVQLIPEPLPALSTSSQDQELDVTMDEGSTPETENVQPEAEQEAESTENEISAHVESAKPKAAPRRALKKLLDRVRSQRNQWTDHSSRVPAADSSTAITDQVPERDTTIDTGSLTSEEKDKLPPLELMLPTHSAMEESTPEDTQLPDVAANRIKRFDKDQQKKEEELEKEKLQQLVLLQELEEQKVKLEQLLLEAQQEREHLKAAVTQESPVIQPEVPQDQVPSVLSTELVPPTGEDDHTRRIRHYQGQLLEQKRIHQRSVEVARQRLEEYQRALRIRYNMTSTSLLPAVTPPRLTQQSLHSAQSVHVPAPLQLPATSTVSACIPVKPQTSVEVLTTGSDMQVSPLHLPGPSFSVGSKVLLNEGRSSLNSPRNQTPDVTAWLTDNIMERVTEHLPESVRSSSSNAEPIPDTFFTTYSANVPLPPSSASVQSISPTITNGAQFVQGYADTNSRTLLHSLLQTASLKSKDHQLEKQKQKLDIASPTSSKDDLERQRQKLQMSFREDELESFRQDLQEESLSSRENDLERQRSDLQAVQRRVLKQRKVVALQQRQQEEQRHRQEVQMEQMRLQKEALQALIDTDTQPATAGEVLVLENTKHTRLKLLASLLRAIEESNGGTLSHLEEPQEKHGFPERSPSSHAQKDPIAQSFVPAGPSPASVLPPGLLPFHQVMKPPVTRVRLGTMGVTEQHELSMIQEVETPINTSLAPVPEDGGTVASHIDSGGVWDLHEKSASSVASDRPQVSSCGQPTNESPAHSVTSSNNLIWRKRLVEEMGASPESSKCDSVLRVISPLSSDSGRGADFSGPTVSNYRSHLESHRVPDSDCLSSTTISSGSYVTTDPEQNADKSPPVGCCEGPRTGADLLNVSSPSGQSSCLKESLGAGLAVHSVFNDGSIQRIIDRYTRELDMSLSTAGRTAHESSSLEPKLSVSRQLLVQAPERRAPTGGSSRGHQSPPPGLAGTQSSSQECNITASPAPEPGGEEQSLAEDPEQDSFRPLIGQLADESSCVMSEGRESAMVGLVGHPSAHSSMIGQLPGLLPLSSDQGGWDSTLSRLIGPLSHQSGSHWVSGGQDFYTGQLMGQMSLEQSSSWLDEGQEESQMRPLVGELDDQHSGNSALPPEVLSHNASVPGVIPQREEQMLQNQTSPMDLGPERTEVFPGSDSFHPLLAEVTHNEMADPPMTFHLPELEEPSSPAEQPVSGQSCISTPVDESEMSPECLRTQEKSICLTALHQSFSSLVISQCLHHESLLTVSPTMRTDVNLTAPTLSSLSMCDDSADVSIPEEEEADKMCFSKKHRASVPSRDFSAEELKCEHSSNLGTDFPVSHTALEFASEKGILEQSEITLVSLTNTTLQDLETTATEEEESGKNKHLSGARQEVQKVQTEGSEFTLLTEEMPGSNNQTYPVKFLEFHWGPSRGLQEEVYQQKRTVLLQKSALRVEEIKAKVAPAKVRTGNHDPSAAREPSKPEESQPIASKAKTKSGSKANNPEANMGSVEHQTTEKSGFIKQKKTQLPPPGSECRLKKVEVKICTLEKRKLDASEMHQRTLRLYEQLEEVKHQKVIRSREEAYAKNRLKAKEFHKKTLQKLRAKQTRQ